MNLKVGDILERVSPDPKGVLLREDFIDTGEVLAISGKLVAILFNNDVLVWSQLNKVEELGWQLKKTEEEKCPVDNCLNCPACKAIKKKTRWVPNKNQYYFYLKDNGGYDLEQFMNQEDDLYRISVGNCFDTREQAEAYRSELIERNK